MSNIEELAQSWQRKIKELEAYCERQCPLPTPRASAMIQAIKWCLDGLKDLKSVNVTSDTQPQYITATEPEHDQYGEYWPTMIVKPIEGGLIAEPIKS